MFTRQAYFDWLHRHSVENRRNDRNKSRVYMKDIDCPPLWADGLHEFLPSNILYHAPSIAVPEDPRQHYQMAALGVAQAMPKSEAAPAGDLMGLVPKDHRAANLMIYVGHEDTYTPMHREMCGTYSQNLMIEASGDKDSQGASNFPGSSFWFMTQNSDSEAIEEFWRSKVARNIGSESYFADPQTLASSGVRIFLHEQKPGDLLIIPSACYQQVWNKGTRTMKVAWNRTTPETLQYAFGGVLEEARLMCRDEQYRCKEIVHASLRAYVTQLRMAGITIDSVPTPAQRHNLTSQYELVKLRKDFSKLFALFTGILLEESFGPDKAPGDVEHLSYDGNVLCSFCKADIYNRFLTCCSCIQYDEDGNADTYDLCMDCFCMGRSCEDVTNFRWVEQHSWDGLQDEYETFRRIEIAIQAFEGNSVSTTFPPEFHIVQERKKTKTAAQICVEEIAKRKKHVKQKCRPSSGSAQPVDETPGEGPMEFTKSGKPKGRPGDEQCHFCKVRFNHPGWKLAKCSGCKRHYCYGNLWRAFGILPKEVLEQPSWECPKCQKICNCGDCRKDDQQKSYVPNKTQIGINAAPFTDPRSTNLYLDFRKPSGWREKLLEFNAEQEGGSASQDIHAGEQTDSGGNPSGAALRQLDLIDPSLVSMSANHLPITNGAPSAQPELSKEHRQRLSSLGVDPNSSPYDHPLGYASHFSPKPAAGRKRVLSPAADSPSKRPMLESTASAAQALMNAQIDPRLLSSANVNSVDGCDERILDVTMETGQIPTSLFSSPAVRMDYSSSSPQRALTPQPSGGLSRLESDPYAFAAAAGLDYATSPVLTKGKTPVPPKVTTPLQPKNTTPPHSVEAPISPASEPRSFHQLVQSGHVHMNTIKSLSEKQSELGVDGTSDSEYQFHRNCYESIKRKTIERGFYNRFLGAVEGRCYLFRLRLPPARLMLLNRKLQREKRDRDSARMRQEQEASARDQPWWMVRDYSSPSEDVDLGEPAEDSSQPLPVPVSNKEQEDVDIHVVSSDIEPPQQAERDGTPVESDFTPPPSKRIFRGPPKNKPATSSKRLERVAVKSTSPMIIRSLASPVSRGKGKRKGKATPIPKTRQAPPKTRTSTGSLPENLKRRTPRQTILAANRRQTVTGRSNRRTRSIYDDEIPTSSSDHGASDIENDEHDSASSSDRTPSPHPRTARTKQAVMRNQIAVSKSQGTPVKSPSLPLRSAKKSGGTSGEKDGGVERAVGRREETPTKRVAGRGEVGRSRTEEDGEEEEEELPATRNLPAPVFNEEEYASYGDDSDDDDLDPVALKLKLIGRS